MPASNHQNPKGGRGGPNPSLASNHSSLVDKTRLATGRRSTPDSEALASSDDEHEMAKSTPTLAFGQTIPEQRSSWLREVKDSSARRQSFTTTVSNNSQPPTPSSEMNAWPGQVLGRVASNPNTGAWPPFGSNNNIWGSETRRDSLPGLVNLSTTTTGLSPGSLLKQSQSQRSATSSGLTDANDQYFPFSIPLHPTPKTYRSQSYSVGQEEAKALQSLANNQGTAISRQKSGVPASLAHRPSRPSGLRDAEGHNMAALREEGDDDSNSDAGVALTAVSGMQNPTDSSRNHLLRQATSDSARDARERLTSSYNDVRPSYCGLPGIPNPGTTFSNFTEPPFFDDDKMEIGLGGNLTRRFSEITTPAQGDGNRRNQWSSASGLGDLSTIPQSRRHSMAEIPTRRNSLVAAAADQSAVFSPTNGDGPITDYSNESHSEVQRNVLVPQQNYQLNAQNSSFAKLYFNGTGPAIRSRIESSPDAQLPPHSMQGYRHGQGLFARPGKDSLLFLVSFKCARADVFHVAEGTGLEVKEGDMVIVEADRGYDLGTVLEAGISWPRARELKEKAADEHYRWLMMFSRHNQTPGSGTANNPRGMMAVSGRERSSQNGPSGLGTGMFDATDGTDSLKPRMIKRLAQPHEVATLRDKEGNEAKAKRVCQQKANELGFGMEILDAEFQMDWKKLSFYYYATQYVNFNALVQELFKIYKTRIWLSAINPDSMIPPPVGPPRQPGPGAVEGRDSPMNPRSASFRQGGANHTRTQDYDPTGAIPPYRNPTTDSYLQYAQANASAYNGQQQPADYLEFAPTQQQYNHRQNGPRTGSYMTLPPAGYPSNDMRQGFASPTNGYGYGQGVAQYYTQQNQAAGVSSDNGLPNSRPPSSGAYGHPNQAFAENSPLQGGAGPIAPPNGNLSSGRQGSRTNHHGSHQGGLPLDFYRQFDNMGLGQPERNQ